MGTDSNGTERLCGDSSGSVWRGKTKTQKVEIFLKDKRGASAGDPAEQRFVDGEDASELAGPAVPGLPARRARLAGSAARNCTPLSSSSRTGP